MKKISIRTTVKKMLADVHTPVGIYLRLRDRFRDTVLLESTDNHAVENSYSFIGINAIAGIEIRDADHIEVKWPGEQPSKQKLSAGEDLEQLLWNFVQRFESETGDAGARFAQGVYGYFSYDAIPFFNKLKLKTTGAEPNRVPVIRYRLYQYVIAINHYKDELLICENHLQGLNSDMALVESLIYSRDIPAFPFSSPAAETSNMSDEDYVQMVQKGIQSCYRGDVFQIVLSRRFQKRYAGDEFNVYRSLRNINPSPYLFFFDYGDYKLFGSSPEAQLIIHHRRVNGEMVARAVMHPIAGTFKRTGDEDHDQKRATELLRDPKENAEHVMLVDLARNDLSTVCSDVVVNEFRQVQYYSHVIHLVSEVAGTVATGANPFKILSNSFPAGTLSGAPKFKAMQLIDQYEPCSRSFYGGAIGFIGLDGSCNHAIMIRTFLAKNNTLFYQAGAGVVAASDPQSELQEVNNKLNALKTAIQYAESI